MKVEGSFMHSAGLAAKAIVGDVVRRMFRSAVSIAQLSRKLVVAQRDWDSWGEDGVFGGYYRAQALQAAMEYHWRVKKHSADPTSTTFDFGDFPVRAGLCPL